MPGHFRSRHKAARPGTHTAQPHGQIGVGISCEHFHLKNDLLHGVDTEWSVKTQPLFVHP